MFPISDSEPARRFPFINYSLIAITCFVFYLQLTAPDFEAFVYQFALVPSTVDFSNSTTLYQFVTSMFLHGGWLHIISNMWFLRIFGDNVEGKLGHFWYLILYFLSGLVGGLAQYMLMANSEIPMLGASGAVAGALGAYFLLFPNHKIKTVIPVLGFVTFTEISAYVMLGYWFVLQILSGAVSLPASGTESGGVAFWAHVGGFVTGLLFGRLFGRAKEGEVI